MMMSASYKNLFGAKTWFFFQNKKPKVGISFLEVPSSDYWIYSFEIPAHGV